MKGFKVLEIALAEVGYKETPFGSNKTKYGEWFSLNNMPWCAIFVSWCYDKANYPLGKIQTSKGFAGCQFAYSYFKDTKRTTNSPYMGDIVFFDWNLDGRMDHCGIFHKWIDETYFESIEGNTGNTSQSNGGEVMIKRRHKKFAKFVHPKALE